MSDQHVEDMLHTQFSPNQVGYITKYVEPISSYETIQGVKELLEQNPEIPCVPVEADEGGYAIIDRDAIAEHHGILDSILHNDIRDYMNHKHVILNAREYADTALLKFFGTESEDLLHHGLVYHRGRYFGVIDLNHVQRHVATLRQEELESARQIQEYLLEQNNEISDNFEVDIMLDMAKELGGDFYFRKKISDDLSFVSCYDVSGKSVSASLATSLISAYFSTLEIHNILEQQTPGTIIKSLNTLFTEHTPSDIYVTALFVFINTKEGVITVYNLGYSPLFFLFPAEGKTVCRAINPQLPPLGIVEYQDLKEGEKAIHIVENLRLFSYSDGLTDAQNKMGERYGDERIKDFLLANFKLRGKEFLKCLHDEIDKFMVGAPRVDDITAVFVDFAS